MDRKSFLTRLGGTAAVVLFPSNAVTAAIGHSPLKNKVKEKIITADEGAELMVLGNPQKHKVVGIDTDDQIFEWVDNLAPGSGIPPHIHTREDEIFRVLKGKVEIMVDNKSTILKEGDMAFAPKNIVHSWKVVGEEEAQMWVSAFPAGMEHMFQELSQMPEGKPDFDEVASICANYGITFV
ncbi:cupin domain-containing protein [Muriicola soli]|uniref:Cupin domain-containing protein n=1 Tax=Muriicola soli TaxID=2507538 RepID=A0A411E6I8_9FLAO|nr:cupin domain-containing protein [Muriicola soli]QBA63123.1 cupin domain-containing protein [Muriicola soli]